nr:amidase [Solirubrobacterales bacterium]
MYFPDAREAPPGIFLARPERVGAGLRLAVKDLFDSAALTTTYGSAIFAEHVPGRSAEAILRLGRAGYALTAKANLHEFAWGITSENPHFGDVPNPLAPDRIAGGSSGGCAAALVAGFVDAALGTDSAGSIRIPSACCGTVGFKPTHGLVSLEGCFPLAPSFDHAGPMARDVAGCEAMMEALVPGFEPRELSSFDGLEVGALWIDEADPGVRARIVEALALMPGAHSADLPTAAPCYAAFMPEAADVHRELYREQGGLYGRNVATKVERALSFTVEQGEAGRRARGEY